MEIRGAVLLLSALPSADRHPWPAEVALQIHIAEHDANPRRGRGSVAG
jgi:hypothetical protein